MHVPVIMVGFRASRERGWLADSWWAVALVGAAAFAIGLGYGRLEVALHARLKRIGRKSAMPAAPAPAAQAA
jgi:hypothetical protein